jgi:hypothetical protein
LFVYKVRRQRGRAFPDLTNLYYINLDQNAEWYEPEDFDLTEKSIKRERGRPFKRQLEEGSMTTLLTHTVAHSTKPFFMPKTNNHPPKKFLSLS